MVAWSGESRAIRWFVRHRNLGSGSLTLVGLVTVFCRAVVDERVLFLGLRGEPGRSSEFPTKMHLHVVIRTNWNCRNLALPSENDIEHSLHVIPS